MTVIDLKHPKPYFNVSIYLFTKKKTKQNKTKQKQKQNKKQKNKQKKKNKQKNKRQKNPLLSRTKLWWLTTKIWLKLKVFK